MSATSAQQTPEPTTRDDMARAVIGLGIGGTVVMAVVIVASAIGLPEAEFQKRTQMVLTTILPLLGTWVGTVLAFYFSRENFEAASRSVERMVELSAEERLREVPVQDEMKPYPDFDHVTLKADDPDGRGVLLADLGKRYKGKISRVPVLTAARTLFCIVHGSAFDKFIAKKSLTGGAADALDLSAATLADLVADADLKPIVTGMTAFIEPTANLAEAKSKMEATPGCQDVFVTSDGQSGGRVVGWLTNRRIARRSRA